MSFNKLPEELVAQVGSHLDITDIESLKLSSKRMYGIVKEFHLDRPVIREMSVDKGYRLAFHIVHRSCRKAEEWIYLKAKDDWISQIAEMLNKCKSIEKLKINDFKIDKDWVNMLAQLRFRIPNLHMYQGEMDLDPQSLVNFCKSYNFVKLRGVKLNKDCITDEVFTQIIPNTFLHYESKYSGRVETNLTDETLNALVKDGRVQCRFNIENFTTKFTVNGMRNLMKTFLEGEFRGLEWNFGILEHMHMAAARDFARELASVGGGKFEVNRMAGRMPGRLIFDITQNEPPIDYDQYDIEEYPDMYDICLENLGKQWGWIQYSVLDR